MPIMPISPTAAPPLGPAWNPRAFPGYFRIFQGISAYSSFFLRAQSSSGGRRLAGSQAATKSFGAKLPVPPLDGRKAFLAHCVQEFHGYLRLFPGISVYSCLFFSVASVICFGRCFAFQV